MIHFGEGRVSIIGKYGEKREIGTLLDMKCEDVGLDLATQESIDYPEMNEEGEIVLTGTAKSAWINPVLLCAFGPSNTIRDGKRIARQRMKEAQRRRRAFVAAERAAPLGIRRAKMLARLFCPRNP